MGAKLVLSIRGTRKQCPHVLGYERGESNADLSAHSTKNRKSKGEFEMKIKRMLAGVLAVVSLCQRQ